MVAVAGDSHSLAELLGALFARRWCRAAWRHHLRACAANLPGTAGDFRACWGGQNPDSGNLFLSGFLISHSLTFNRHFHLLYSQPWVKKFALECSFLGHKMPCKHAYQVFLFHYTILNKPKACDFA